MVTGNQSHQENSFSNLKGLIVEFQAAGISLIATISDEAGTAPRRSTEETNMVKNQRLRHMFGNVGAHAGTPTEPIKPVQSKNDHLRNLFGS